MKLLKKWNLWRLTKRSTWKSVDKFELFAGILVCIVAIYVWVEAGADVWFLNWLMPPFLCCMVYLLLSSVCRAYKCFDVGVAGCEQTVCLYKNVSRVDAYQVVIRQGDDIALLDNIRDYRFMHFLHKDSLLLQIDECWYFLHEDGETLEKLGEQINEAAFVEKNTVKMLNVEGKLISFTVSEVFWGKRNFALLPTEDEKKILLPSRYHCFVCRHDDKLRLYAAEYQTAEENGKGIWAASQTINYYGPSFVIRDTQRRVRYLVWDDAADDYREIFAEYSLIRNLSDVVIVVPEQFKLRLGLYGKLLRFSPEEKKMETMYEGLITYIHFDDGEMGGSNGFSYHPQPEDSAI